jgi:hypothetical protein
MAKEMSCGHVTALSAILQCRGNGNVDRNIHVKLMERLGRTESGIINTSSSLMTILPQIAETSSKPSEIS